MINEKGDRVAGPKPVELPPHMLAGMTSAGQKRVLARWKRGESRAAAKKTTGKTTAKTTTKTAAKRSGAKRVAKKATAKAAPAPAENKESTE